jgi:hypothetical protein
VAARKLYNQIHECHGRSKKNNTSDVSGAADWREHSVVVATQDWPQLLDSVANQ